MWKIFSIGIQGILKRVSLECVKQYFNSKVQAYVVTGKVRTENEYTPNTVDYETAYRARVE